MATGSYYRRKSNLRTANLGCSVKKHCISAIWHYINKVSSSRSYTYLGGDQVSTWVTKLKVHAEDCSHLVKNVTKFILANSRRKLAVVKSRRPSNDGVFGDVAKAA